TTVIGGFVISAIALLITAVVLFGSGSLWKHTQPYVLYFEGSVKGLGVGSPVMFRGVQIGTVKSIVLQSDPQRLGIHIPVTVEINENKFQHKKGKHPDIQDHFDRLIKRGLRAQLDLQSIVTGQLFIQLDFLPDTPVKLSGLENEYPEIPTVKSSLFELTTTLKDMPIKQISDNLLEISDRVNELLYNPKVDQILDRIDSAAAGADCLIANANTLMHNTEESITEAADSATRVLTKIDQEVQPVSDGLIKALDSAKKALNQADTTLGTVDRFVDHSDTRVKLNRLLDEVTSAVRSLGELTDYLERHPEALLRGKNGRGE
ncbi:MAG: MlaD family protein, partial [Thermodesulfobacteriota bacterium]|nr:MlaD family protein [Thermodesulfobacteriota bacterium]